MKQLFVRIFDFFNTVESKIAFYPTLLSVSGIVLAAILIYLEKRGVSREIMEVWPMLMVEDGDTALSVLSVCLGGLISLMVFSFSMVMLLLSQASSNYSPRLLPGLISDKRHQFILGVYLATILYNIFTLFTIEPSDDKYALPGLSVLLGIVFTIFCLVAFIYFIHNISQSIQVNNILDNIFSIAQLRLKRLISSEEGEIKTFPNTEQWHAYPANCSGYFQNLSIDNISQICEKANTRIYIVVPKGLYILKNATFFKSEKPLPDNVVKSIISNISLAKGELVSDNYTLAFKQITEIAVKAMSPGVNDPGTAINAVDYLTILLALRMLKRDTAIIARNNNVNLRIAVITFKEMLYQIMASLRTYCVHDPIMVQKLFWMLQYLSKQPAVEPQYYEAIKTEMNTLFTAAKDSLKTEVDVQYIEKMYRT